MNKQRTGRNSDNRPSRSPRKSGGGRPANDNRTGRPRRADDDKKRPFKKNDSGSSSYRDKPKGDGDRPSRPYKPRTEGGSSDRPYRPRREGEGSDRPSRPYKPRPEGGSSDRPYRPRREGEGSDRPSRPYKPRPEGGSSDRPYRPRREGEGSDRPSRPYKPRPEGGSSDRPYRPRREGEGSDRPSRPYKPRTEGGSSDRPYRPKREEGGADRPYRQRRDEGGSSSSRPYTPRRDNDNSSDRPSRPYKPRTEGDSDRPYRPKREEGGDRPYTPRRDDDRNDSRRPRTSKYGQPDRPASESNFDEFLDKKRETNKKNILSLDAAKQDMAFEKIRKRDKPVLQFEDQGLVRLNKFIAQAGICSRREADSLIADGLIKVNGNVITEMGVKISPTDLVEYKGRRLQGEKLVYIVMNKPKDYITTVDDPEDRKTVLDLIGTACQERIYPVGRLDRNTTGVLLLTNDGHVAQTLMHPSNNILKIYQVDLDKPLSREDYEVIKEGVTLEDGFIRPDAIEYVSDTMNQIGVEIHSGKNRIVRRIFESLGYQVLRLDRIAVGPLTKKTLPRGHWRFLSEREVGFLKMMKVDKDK